MLTLIKPTVPILKEYYGLIKDRVIEARNNSNLNQRSKLHLTERKIKEIILSEPNLLPALHTRVIESLGHNFNIAEYRSYLVIKDKEAAQRTPLEIQVFNKYDPHITELKSVFDYDRFISAHKITSYALAKILDRNTCTYCNRIYTITIVERDIITKRFNNEHRITRPQFDHWYPKSIFPALAMSFYNLIPSCSICNSTVKGSDELNLTDHLHPYLDDMATDFVFSYDLESVYEAKVKVIAKENSKCANTLKALRVLSVYGGHSNLELKDLLELKLKYPKDYLETLFKSTFKGLSNESEVYRLIFGVELDNKNFHKRPFSKFKTDIISQLRKI
jgi:hypothetical protein